MIRQKTTRAAFTLAEVMIAMGIMVIGLTMVASLFPAAIKENESSIKDSVGPIIADNGLTIAGTLLRKSQVPSLTFVPLADESMTYSLAIPRIVQHYPQRYRTLDDINKNVWTNPPYSDPGNPPIPWNDPFWLRGSVLLGRQVAANSTDFELIGVSYTKSVAQNEAVLVPVTGIYSSDLKFLVPDDNNHITKLPNQLLPAQRDVNRLRIGSPLILVTDVAPTGALVPALDGNTVRAGAFGKILMLNPGKAKSYSNQPNATGTEIVLDRSLYAGVYPTQPNAANNPPSATVSSTVTAQQIQAYVVVERWPNDYATLHAKSPAMATSTLRTGLPD